MAEANKTCQSSGSKLSQYLGPGKELIASEVPTFRAALRKAILILQEFVIQDSGDKRNLPVKNMIKMTVEKICDQWLHPNHLFIPPVTVNPGALERRLQNAWDKFSDIAKGRAKVNVKAQWEPKIDRLFDVTVCQCPITLCTNPESPCFSLLKRTLCKMPGGAHISCN